MLVNLYSSKTPIAVFSLPVAIGVLCVPIFFTEASSTQYLIDWQTILTNWVLETKWLNYVLTVSILSITAHQINNVYNRHVFYSKATFLPGFIYILSLLTLEYFSFSTNLVAHLFLVFALGFMMRIRRQDPAKTSIFWGSVFIGLAIGFSSLQMSMLLLPWLTLIAIRPFVWREWVIMILGAVLPLIYYVSIFYLAKGDLDFSLNEIENVTYRKMNLLRAANYAVPLLIVIGTLVKYFSVMRTQINRFKKLSQILFHFSWLSVTSWLVGMYFFDLSIYSFAIPVAFFVGTAILYSKRQSMVNIIVIIWLIISVANLVSSTF